MMALGFLCHPSCLVVYVGLYGDLHLKKHLVACFCLLERTGVRLYFVIGKRLPAQERANGVARNPSAIGLNPPHVQ